MSKSQNYLDKLESEPFFIKFIDTRHNFPVTLVLRDRLIKSINEQLIVRSVTDTIQKKQLLNAKGKSPSRNTLQAFTLQG